MKKIMILSLVLILLTGCGNESTNEEKYVYVDIYDNQGYSENCYTDGRYFGGAYFCKVKSDFAGENYIVVKEYKLNKEEE